MRYFDVTKYHLVFHDFKLVNNHNSFTKLVSTLSMNVCDGKQFSSLYGLDHKNTNNVFSFKIEKHYLFGGLFALLSLFGRKLFHCFFEKIYNRNPLLFLFNTLIHIIFTDILKAILLSFILKQYSHIIHFESISNRKFSTRVISLFYSLLVNPEISVDYYIRLKYALHLKESNLYQKSKSDRVINDKEINNKGEKVTK